MESEILSYIPQRDPFVMIGQIIASDEYQTISTYTITEDNLFVNDGMFSESGMLENMAQTAAAGVGLRRQKAGLPLQSGYIAALRNVVVHALPKVNETITTDITMEQTIMSFHIVKGSIRCGEKEIVSCEFKIFVNN